MLLASIDVPVYSILYFSFDPFLLFLILSVDVPILGFRPLYCTLILEKLASYLIRWMRFDDSILLSIVA